MLVSVLPALRCQRTIGLPLLSAYYTFSLSDCNFDPLCEIMALQLTYSAVGQSEAVSVAESRFCAFLGN